MTQTNFIDHLVQAVLECDGGPAETRALIGRAIADTLAVAAAGFSEDVTTASIRAYSGDAATLWSGARCEGRDAAVFCNAVAAHALDFDDVLLDSTIHASTVILPAILEMDHEVASSELVAAFGAGLVAARAIGRLVGHGHYHKGWHATATFGALVAAAAAARLHRLDAAQARHAFALAASQSAGMKRNFGTMAKPCHAGFAASAGLRAVRLAQAGIDGAANIFEGKAGYAALYGTGDGEAVPGADAFTLRPDRVSLKLYPCCYAAHRLIGIGLDARRHLGDAAFAGGVSATLLVPAGSVDLLREDDPKTPLAAKFSAKYCLAVALADGPPTLASFTDAALQRPGLSALLDRIAIVDDATQQSHGDIEMGRITLELSDAGGRPIGRYERAAIPGSPDAPPDAGDVAIKIDDCLGVFRDSHGHDFAPLLRLAGDADVAAWLPKPVREQAA